MKVGTKLNYKFSIKHSKLNIQNYTSHVWHLFVIRTTMRDELQKYLNDNGIKTLIHYPVPPHKQGAYKEWDNLSFPITEKVHEEVLSLPISPVLSFSDVDVIIDNIKNYFSSVKN